MSYCRCTGNSEAYIFYNIYGYYSVYTCNSRSDVPNAKFTYPQEVLDYIQKHDLNVPERTIERLKHDVENWGGS